MATFAELKTEVALLVIDAPTAVTQLVGTWVNRAVKKLQVKHNFKVMESDATFTTTYLTRILGQRPNDWKEPRDDPYYIEELGRTRDMFWLQSRAEADARFGTSTDFDYGPAQGIYENDLPNEFDIYPYPDGLSDYPDGEYRIVVPYWKYLPNMIADGDTNWFSINAEQYIIYQAVAEAFYANEDEGRAQTWEARAREQYKDVVDLDKRRRLAEVKYLVPHLGALRPHTQR